MSKPNAHGPEEETRYRRLDALLARSHRAVRDGQFGEAVALLDLLLGDLIAIGNQLQPLFERMARLESELGHPDEAARWQRFATDQGEAEGRVQARPSVVGSEDVELQLQRGVATAAVAREQTARAHRELARARARYLSAIKLLRLTGPAIASSAVTAPELAYVDDLCRELRVAAETCRRALHVTPI